MQFAFSYNNYVLDAEAPKVEPKWYQRLLPWYHSDTKKKYRTTLLKEHRTQTKLTSNITRNHELLEPVLQAKHKLFACLNDDIDHSLESSQLVADDVKEFFYEKKFPDMSHFEIGYEFKVQNRRKNLDITEISSGSRVDSLTLYWIILTPSTILAVAFLVLNSYRSGLKLPFRLFKNKLYTRL